MAEPFDSALAFVLAREGPYSNDPLDPGGETKFGISKRAHPDVDILNLTLEEAASIYRRDYWLKTSCQDFPALVALLVFDCAVNQGVGTALRLLQEVLGVTADGVVGPKTLFAVRLEVPIVLARLFQARRIMRYAESPRWAFYGRGWMDRVLLGYQAALKLEAHGSVTYNGKE